MNNILLLTSSVLILSIFMYKYLSKLGIPMLLLFIGLGIIFGENGIFKIEYDDYILSRDICSFALIFIIFFGGFGTKLSMARGIIKKALSLSTLGVLLTAILTALFSYYILNLDWQISFLLGAVLSPTDATSVFSILRSHKLNLKEKTASLLEIESGSNDPFSYILTLAFLNFSNINFFHLPILLFQQIIIGIFFAYIIARITIYIMRKTKNLDSAYLTTFLTGIMLLTYSLVDKFGGNAYIAVYALGIIIGNSKFKTKKEIVHFFNAITGIMQILIFFLLGLLITPSKALIYIFPAISLMIALTFFIRPLIVSLLFIPFKSSNKQKILVAWSGLRGASSVVFSILVVVAQKDIGNIVFNIAFIVVLLSIAIQGSLLPYISKKIDMIDENGNVLKTFNDYSDEEEINFITFEINKAHKWVGKKINEINLMPSVLLVLIERNNENIIPKGNTVIEEGDKIVLCGSSFINKEYKISLFEKNIDNNSELLNKAISEIDKNLFIIMIKRGESTIIPRGNTVIEKDDILVLLDKA